MPEKAPRWDLTGTEGCGGGKVVCGSHGCFQGIRVYIGEGTRSGELRGAHEVGGMPYPLGVSSCLVAASLHLRLHLQVFWFPSGSRKIIAKVHSIWTPFGIPFMQNSEIGKKQQLALGLWLIG